VGEKLLHVLDNAKKDCKSWSKYKLKKTNLKLQIADLTIKEVLLTYGEKLHKKTKSLLEKIKLKIQSFINALKKDYKEAQGPRKSRKLRLSAS